MYLLFEKKIDPDVKDNNGCTLVHWACYHPNFNVLLMLDHMGLVDKYLDERDAQGQTPIFKALYKKND